jgi:hypothetical protein
MHVDLLGFTGLGFAIDAIDNVRCESHNEDVEVRRDLEVLALLDV